MNMAGNIPHAFRVMESQSAITIGYDVSARNATVVGSANITLDEPGAETAKVEHDVHTIGYEVSAGNVMVVKSASMTDDEVNVETAVVLPFANTTHESGAVASVSSGREQLYLNN